MYKKIKKNKVQYKDNDKNELLIILKLPTQYFKNSNTTFI